MSIEPRCKFALRDYRGRASRFVLVEEERLSEDSSALRETPAHQVFIVDASGSMTREMSEMKATIEKLFTLEEYHSAQTRFSLISYASSGDVQLHFSRVTVESLNRAGSPERETVRALRSRGLTCISQAMELALSLIEPDELTCVSLHSDGYANDLSPTGERALIDELIERFKGQAMTFVNTIAYRESSDFRLLGKIAQALSGRCLQAGHIGELYECLKSATDELINASALSYVSSGEGYHYQCYVNQSSRRVLGSSSELRVVGIDPEDQGLVFRYREVDEARFMGSSAPECGVGSQGLQPLAAYALCQLTEGKLNAAKYGLVSLRAPELLARHAKALTAAQLAALASELQAISLTGLKPHEPRSEGYGFDSSTASVLRVLDVIKRHAQHIKLDLKSLLSDYKRATIRRVEGTRNEDGELCLPWLTTRVVGDEERAQVLSVKINHNDAEIDMMVSQELELVEREGGDQIHEVAGIELRGRLKSFNSYKLVTGGLLTVPSLRLKLESKQAHRELVELGVLSGDFKPTELYTVSLSDRPLVDYELEVGPLGEAFAQLTRGRAIDSLLSALLKDRSVDYTDEQLAELKRHFISPQLHLSIPSTPHYVSLEEAIEAGEVDARVNYKIDLGDHSLLNVSKLRSANAQLARRFTVSVDGLELESAKMQDWWREGFSVSAKGLSSRSAADPVDALMTPLLADFFELGSEGALSEALSGLGVEAALLESLKAVQARALTGDEAELVLHQIQRQVKRKYNELYERVVCPLIFYIGATGVLPDDLSAELLKSEAVEERFPALKLSKSDRDKQLFSLEGALLSVYEVNEYYSVD